MMHQLNQVISDLWLTGHFWDLAKRNVLNISSLEEAQKLGSLSHPIVKEALQSRQESDINYELLYKAQRFTQLAVRKEQAQLAEEWALIEVPFDGELDPATDTLLSLKRCAMPDHAPPQGILGSFAIRNDDESMSAFWMALLTMPRGFGTGSGSWPAPGCDTELPDSHKQFHSIVVQIDISNAPARFKDPTYHKKGVEYCVNAYAEMGLLVRYDLEGKYAKPHIKKKFENLWGSVIGWNEFPQSGTCNQTINGRLDTGYVPTDPLMWANLEVHETGHGVGAQHTRGGIMNPSIIRIDPLSWIGTPSESNMKRWFGGERVFPPGRPLTWEDFVLI